MPQKVKPSAQYEGLLRQQVRPDETLDGIFVVGSGLTIAITSDRLLIVGPTPPNGWGLKSIPWRLLTEIEQETADPRSIRLRYEVAAKRTTGVWASTPEPGVGENAGLPPGELLFALPEDAGNLATLFRTHIEAAKPAQQN